MPSEVVNLRVWKYCFLPAFFALSGYGRLLIFLGQDSIRVSESGISRISGKLRIFGISRISGILGSSRAAAACYAICSVGEISGVIGNEGTNA